MSSSPRISVFLHSGDYDLIHQGLSIAATATACGRPAELFFFWWALDRLAKDQLDEPDFGPGREEVSDRFERLRAPTLRELLTHLRESKLCALYACTGSMGILGLRPVDLEGRFEDLKWVGWSTILQLTAGVTDRFYL